MITIGIDPGWASFGVAIQEDEKYVHSDIFIPKAHGSIVTFITDLDRYLSESMKDLTAGEYRIYIERFVTYGGVQVDPENILMLIGALDYYFSLNYSKPILIKALDWKVKLCHHLVKTTGESNPSKSLDKKFSLWAAEKVSGQKFKSDHEADAVCLSYLSSYLTK